MGQHTDELLRGQPGHQRHADGQHLAVGSQAAPATLEMHAGIYLGGKMHGHWRLQVQRLAELMDQLLQAGLGIEVELELRGGRGELRKQRAGEKQQHNAAADRRYHVGAELEPEAETGKPEMHLAEIPAQGHGQGDHQSGIERRDQQAAGGHQADMGDIATAGWLVLEPSLGEGLQGLERIGRRLGREGFDACFEPDRLKALVQRLGASAIQPLLQHPPGRRQQPLGLSR